MKKCSDLPKNRIYQLSCLHLVRTCCILSLEIFLPAIYLMLNRLNYHTRWLYEVKCSSHSGFNNKPGKEKLDWNTKQIEQKIKSIWYACSYCTFFNTGNVIEHVLECFTMFVHIFYIFVHFLIQGMLLSMFWNVLLCLYIYSTYGCNITFWCYYKTFKFSSCNF